MEVGWRLLVVRPEGKSLLEPRSFCYFHRSDKKKFSKLLVKFLFAIS